MTEIIGLSSAALAAEIREAESFLAWHPSRPEILAHLEDCRARLAALAVPVAPVPVSPAVLSFSDVALYRGGMFGISRVNCRTIVIKPGQKYAQYSDAVRIEYLEKGKRKPHAFMLAGIECWARVLDLAAAIDPDPALVRQADGNSVSRYSSCDPRWETDFENKLAAAGVVLLYSVGAGRRGGGR